MPSYHAKYINWPTLTEMSTTGCNKVGARICKCTNHCLSKEIPNNADVFIDDMGAKEPFSNYNNKEVAPGI